MSSLLLAAVSEILSMYSLKECVTSLASLGTIIGQQEKNSTAVPALKLYSLILYLKSFTKGDEKMALMQTRKLLPGKEQVQRKEVSNSWQ